MIKQSSTASATKVDLSDVPESVIGVVMDRPGGFKIKYVLRKNHEGQVYYDVGGAYPDGLQVEVDVLLTESGPKILQEQTDIDWVHVPSVVSEAVKKENAGNIEIVRVVANIQPDGYTIIFEFFADERPLHPRFKVSLSDTNEVVMLPSQL
ncbi:hypothetical protein GCM10009069_21940 [Algimonas arctica]|uniref:PepSY domain-containing protein n=2 Tax=Algimonas arctica TaxID=1479486 RepID=A0A8J3CQW8_9PROT|nr:hypothetical protein GCM10009069_21940 [Algimonas arctica]